MAENTFTAAAERGTSLKQVLVWILALGLGALAFWLASERNARRWYLVPDEGQMVVKKGILFPVGSARFKTDDPALAQTYGPVPTPAAAALPGPRDFDDRAGLDQALYELLSKWAREDIASEKPERLERGLAYVARAERLPGLSAAQHDDLRTLRGESGYFEALWFLERGAEDLRMAREKLRLAADAPTRHASEAQVLLRKIEPLVQQALEAGHPEPKGGKPGSPAGQQPSSDARPAGPQRTP